MCLKGKIWDLYTKVPRLTLQLDTPQLIFITLRWRHNDYDGVSNHQPLDCLLECLFSRRSKNHQSSASPAFVRGIHRWPVNSPHKGPVTRKSFHLMYIMHLHLLLSSTYDIKCVCTCVCDLAIVSVNLLWKLPVQLVMKMSSIRTFSFQWTADLWESSRAYKGRRIRIGFIMA